MDLKNQTFENFAKKNRSRTHNYESIGFSQRASFKNIIFAHFHLEHFSSTLIRRVVGSNPFPKNRTLRDLSGVTAVVFQKNGAPMPKLTNFRHQYL